MCIRKCKFLKIQLSFFLIIQISLGERVFCLFVCWIMLCWIFAHEDGALAARNAKGVVRVERWKESSSKSKRGKISKKSFQASRTNIIKKFLEKQTIMIMISICTFKWVYTLLYQWYLRHHFPHFWFLIYYYYYYLYIFCYMLCIFYVMYMSSSHR